MYVIKRSGKTEPIKYDKITERNLKIAKELYGNNIPIDLTKLSQLIIQGLKSGMTTTEIDELSSETATHMSTYQPEYDKLASAIAISNLHKSTEDSFLKTMRKLYNYTSEDGRKYGLISDEMFKFMTKNKEEIEKTIDYKRDFNYTYFGFKTLEKSYLLKIDNKVVERPQHMLMRCSIGIHGPSKKNKYEGNIQKVIETYNEISNGKFTHASPTLYNSCSIRPQMSSCFLLHMDDDLNHMYQTALRSALISKYAGGIGIDISNIRCKGSKVHSTNGNSNGIIPMIKVFNQVALHCDQCFTPETIIYTKNSQKCIKDIKIGDEVLTMDGTYKPVVNVIKNKANKEILKIRSKYSFENVNVTKEHQIYTIKNQIKNKTNFKEILNKLNKGYIKPEFTNAGDLTENDFIGFPLEKLPIDINENKDEEDFFRFYGIMLGDGHICSTRNESGVTLNKNSKIETYIFVKNYLEKNNINYWEHDSKNNNSVSIRWTTTNFILNYDDLYNNENKEKRIHEKYINLSRKNRLSLLKGLIETDGSNLKEIYFSTTSYELAQNIRYILLSLGILSSGNIKDNRGKTHEIRPNEFITNKKISYAIRISKNKILNEIMDIKTKGVYCSYFIYDNIIWSRIKNVETINYEGDVYDLSILDNNNYTVGSLGLVHNSGKRKGSIAMYLQPWHPDVLDFLQLRFNSPPEELRARDIFIAMWIPDIFMKRVEKDEMWTLICPSKCKELTNTYGEEFDKIYEECEQKGIFNKQIKARVIWDAILRSQEETGLPYMLYKDSVNNKNNQKNIGLIRSSNLCCEILEYTDKDSIAVCNLASIALPKYIYEDENKELKFDYKELGRITEMITENLNLIIDKNFYPVPEAEHNNLSYRPIGIGIQGLADVFAMLNYTWDSKEAKELNQKIFEYIYYHAVKKSNELGIKDGSYSAFKGSPISQGILQYHMWNKTPLSEELNWKELEENVKNGMRNSLLVAPMPTASTAQILNNNEAFEPFTSNIYSRSVLAGDFVCVNKHLYKKLKEINLWNKSLVDKIIANNGSIQKIDEIPKHIKDIYKTVWEIPQRILIDMAADRGAFIDQSQSLNIFIDHPTHAKLSSMHFYGWKKGLKTGSYYIRSKPSREAIKFTIDNKVLDNKSSVKNNDDGECLMCSS